MKLIKSPRDLSCLNVRGTFWTLVGAVRNCGFWRNDQDIPFHVPVPSMFMMGDQEELWLQENGAFVMLSLLSGSREVNVGAQPIPRWFVQRESSSLWDDVASP